MVTTSNYIINIYAACGKTPRGSAVQLATSSPAAAAAEDEELEGILEPLSSALK